MIRAYRTLLGVLSPGKRRQFWFVTGAMVIASCLDLAGIAMILPFLAVLLDPSAIRENALLSAGYDFFEFTSNDAFLLALGLATFGFIVVSILARAISFYIATRFARQVNLELGMARLAQYVSQPYEWFLRKHSADLSKSVLQEIKEITQGTVIPSLRIIANGVLVLLITGLLIRIEPMGAVVIGLTFATSLWSIDHFVKQRLREMGADRRRANQERHQVTGEILSGIKEVKMMALEEVYLKRFFVPSERLARYQTRLALIGEAPRFVLELLTFGGMLAFALWLLWTNNGAVDRVVPVIGAFAFAALRLMPTMQLLFRDISAIRFGNAALEGLAEDLRGARPSIAAPARLDKAARMPVRQAIRLDGVSYIYPGAEAQSLHEVTVEIPAGGTLGIVGPTGAGKSTLVDLILGLIQPTRGHLRVDGTVVDDASLRSWQAQIGFVPQMIHLVDATLAENIAHGVARDAIDMDRVRAAGDMAQVKAFLGTLSHGYDTSLGDRGIRLSGGQRQRVGIARALYLDQDVLVLDEATSALDTVTEARVMQGIHAMHARKTLLIVSHRLSSLAHCDRILVMKDGRIESIGTFEELRGGSPEFRALLEAAE